MQLGKRIRWERIINRVSGRTLIVPMDHGVTDGVIKGLDNMSSVIADMAAGGVDAMLMHKGLIRRHYQPGAGRGLIMHISASTSIAPDCNSKCLVATVEEALRLGADAVSMHVNLGDVAEARMLSDLGHVAEQCERWGMPLLAMMYARGPLVTNGCSAESIAHCVRVGLELGADIIKVSYPGSAEAFAEIVQACNVPIVIAGGKPAESTEVFLQTIKDAMDAGATGLSVGRNVFQHPRRRALLRAMRAIVHESSSVEQALQLMEQADA